jgi:hypothetical protein
MGFLSVGSVATLPSTKHPANPSELPKSLDETYERVLKEIGMANRDLAHRLLQCLTWRFDPCVSRS